MIVGVSLIGRSNDSDRGGGPDNIWGPPMSGRLDSILKHADEVRLAAQRMRDRGFPRMALVVDRIVARGLRELAKTELAP